MLLLGVAFQLSIAYTISKRPVSGLRSRTHDCAVYTASHVAHTPKAATQ
jgi:hypothetical protein